MIWENTYRDIAYNLHNTIAQKTEGTLYAKTALYAIVDMPSADGGTEATVALLRPMKDFVVAVFRSVHYERHLKRIIRAINDFTVNNYGGDLTTFVNSVEWRYGCIPYYWAYYTEEGGYDTSEWTVCS